MIFYIFIFKAKKLNLWYDPLNPEVKPLGTVLNRIKLEPTVTEIQRSKSNSNF